MTDAPTGNAEPEAPKKAHLIGYARVSMSDQNPDLQIDALVAYGVDRRDIYVEKASGKDTNRPEFQAMLKDCRAGDLVVVWKLDRLGRTAISVFQTAETIRAKGADLVLLGLEGMDTRTLAGRLMFQMLAIFAEFERGIILERTMAELQAARDWGVKGGRREQYTDDQVREVMHLPNRTAAAKLGMILTHYIRRANKLRGSAK